MNTILFIHGLGGKPYKTWYKFEKLLRTDSDFSDYKILFFPYPTSIIKIFPWSIFPRIQTLADSLRTFIFHRTSFDDKITIITHSMGGLIAKKYLIEELKRNNKIRIKKLLLYACQAYR